MNKDILVTSSHISEKIQQFEDFNKVINAKESANQLELVDKLKEYVRIYDLIPVLVKAFENDNLTFYKANDVPNDDFLLANYITDLYLSFQKGKELKTPDEKVVDEIFDCCMKIYESSLIIEMTGDEIDEDIKDDVLMFRYTERSFYIDILSIIFFNIVDKEYLSYFYDKTGFYLQNIFIFRNAITCLIQDRFENNKQYDGNVLAFSAEDILNYINMNFHLKNSIDISEIQSFIKYFYIDSSDNNNYLPRFNNTVGKKPIFNYEDKYICSEPLRMIKSIFSILENELKNDSKLLNEYYASRGKNLENLARNILINLFPEAEVYQDLNYLTKDQKEHETDIIVDIGNYLIIAEAKSGKFRPQAKEGNSKIFKNSINKIIAEAHEQCRTTYEYIQQNKISTFYKKGQDSSEISFDKNNYIDIFLFTVELENLDSITSDIYRTIPVYKENPILTFSIYDLYIIADILKKGSLFMIYLNQRRENTLNGKIHASNELDYLSLFLESDLKFQEKDESGHEISEIAIDNYSDVLDKYYSENKKINSYPIAVGANILFQQLKKYDKKLGFVIEKEFLSANIDVQKDILRKIDAIKKRSSDERGHDCSFLLKEGNVGISFFAYKKKEYFCDDDLIERYVKLKLMQTKVKFWFYVVFSVKPNKVSLISFFNNTNV